MSETKTSSTSNEIGVPNMESTILSVARLQHAAGSVATYESFARDVTQHVLETASKQVRKGKGCRQHVTRSRSSCRSPFRPSEAAAVASAYACVERVVSFGAPRGLTSTVPAAGRLQSGPCQEVPRVPRFEEGTPHQGSTLDQRRTRPMNCPGPRARRGIFVVRWTWPSFLSTTPAWTRPKPSLL